jgi:hypothetical protein
MKATQAPAPAANVDIVVDTEGLSSADADVEAESLMAALRDTIPNIRLAQRLVDMPPK